MQELTYTWIADFTMKGRLAYLSHQETMTLIQRAMVRAQIPLVFSSGFNPRPHLSLPLPRSVGVQSDAERLCATVNFTQLPDADSVREAVERQMPAGCRFLSSSLVPGKVTFYPSGYLLRFMLNESVDAPLLRHIQDSIADRQSGRPLVIQRYQAKKDSIKPLDIAPYVEQIEWQNNTTIDVRCRVSQDGTVRVDELMQWLKLQPELLAEPARRMEIYWKTTAA